MVHRQFPYRADLNRSKRSVKLAVSENRRMRAPVDMNERHTCKAHPSDCNRKKASQSMVHCWKCKNSTPPVAHVHICCLLNCTVNRTCEDMMSAAGQGGTIQTFGSMDVIPLHCMVHKRWEVLTFGRVYQASVPMLPVSYGVRKRHTSDRCQVF